ncbi:MAG: TrmH family RNA methyltransferase [Bacteroidetes bacterium]|nr:MAG: TrmH family RNA methyltransferase [Bacteroidota bacterium]
MSQPDSQARLFAYLAQYLQPERLRRFEEVLAWRTRYLTVAVEELHKPRNTSAVLRSCEGFGIQDVHIIAGAETYPIHKLIAGGAAPWLTVHRHRAATGSAAACIGRLRAQGYRIVATSPHAEQQVEDLGLDRPLALFFGSELEGLSETVLSQADVQLRIPMYGFTESLNLSVSAALLLHDLSRRLHARDDLPWRLSEAEKMDLRVAWATRSLKYGYRYVRRFWREEGERPA